MLERIEKLQILLVGLIIAFALLIVAKVVSSTMSQNVITVTGSAYEIVKSDSGSIDLEIRTTASTKQIAYKTLNKQLETVKKYLSEKNIKDIDIKSVNSYANYKRDSMGVDTNIVVSYTANQPLSIKSNDVELIKEISTDISNLIDDGIDITVYEANYNYSKLSDLKVKLLEKASIDAKQRATSMLKPTRNSVGKIQSVRMGVYQITPVDSTNVSDGGINDTSTIDKKVTAVANISFRIK